MLVAVFVIEVPTQVSATVTEEWVVRYDGGYDTSDLARGTVVDSSGNVYVTGKHQDAGTGIDSYSTVAYDTNGNLLWSAKYNDPANNSDSAYDIALDEQSGNVYVTGSSRVGNYKSDMTTVAYDSNGNQLWVAKYQGIPGDYSLDHAKAITVDPSGNVIVAGRTYVSGDHNWDYIVLKYDINGILLWEAQYDGPLSYFDVPLDVTTDAEGNVYVTGCTDVLYFYGDDTPDPDPALATMKYDPSGNLLWLARYDDPVKDIHTIANKIAVDPSGNVYITGNSEGNGTDEDILTIAYDNKGSELWVARYNGPGNGMDQSYDLALGPSGNIYVVGASDQFFSGYDYIVIAYDAQGNRLWLSTYNGPDNLDDFGIAIDVDILGNIYVTGESHVSSSPCDCATIRYDSAGNEIWVQRYDGPQNDLDAGMAIGVDDQCNVYATLWSAGLGSKGPYNRMDYAIIKYSQDLSDQPPAAAAGSDQSVHVDDAVYFDGSGSFDFNGTIVNYDWDFGDGSPHGTGPTPTHIYTSPGTYTVTLTVTDADGMQGNDTCVITVEIPLTGLSLYEGWNLISLPTLQTESEVLSVLSSINGDYDTLQWFDAQDAMDPWKGYSIEKPPYMNDLENLDHTKGIWIHITAPGGTTLLLDGEKPTSTQHISLYPGWNMVGYPSQNDRTRTTALNNIAFGTDVDCVMTYNCESQSWEEIGKSDYLEVGKGYWVHSLVEKVWDIPNPVGPS
ncbi:MAG: SBBP repeat-containing protein [Thermoplasmata archaeon]|nr:MAG: SBBP repeat-containing protein [Thermoplasmata archaeon]